MTLHLLDNQQLLQSIPPEIKLVENYGQVTIKRDLPGKADMLSGNHIVISGEPEDIRNWLAPYKSAWLGEGPPMMQQFRLADIKQ